VWIKLNENINCNFHLILIIIIIIIIIIINQWRKHCNTKTVFIKRQTVWTNITYRMTDYITLRVNCHIPYTGCLGRNVPDFGRMFLKLKYTDITKNTYIQSWTVMEILAREKCGLLAFPPTLLGLRDVLAVHCACPSFSLQPGEAYWHCSFACKVFGTLSATMTLVRVFM